jgi:hypothetical protein
MLMSDSAKHLLRQITKDFKDVRQLVDKHNELKKQIRTIDRKLKTIETKYSFLTDIISVDGNDRIIEVAAKKLLKNAGFTDVRRLENVRPKREDLQIWCSDCIILAECKGTKHSVPKDNEIGQVKKYVDYRKNKIISQLPVFGITIINHDNSKSFNHRNKNPIDKYKHEYAVSGQYGIITSIELVNGFLKLKNNIISFDDFKNKIKQFGLITF